MKDNFTLLLVALTFSSLLWFSFAFWYFSLNLSFYLFPSPVRQPGEADCALRHAADGVVRMALPWARFLRAWLREVRAHMHGAAWQAPRGPGVWLRSLLLFVFSDWKALCWLQGEPGRDSGRRVCEPRSDGGRSVDGNTHRGRGYGEHRRIGRADSRKGAL
jgi:hypothetical protein